MVKKIIISFVVLFFGWNNVFASHLVGGSLDYRLVATSPTGNLRYEVTLTLYRDCASVGTGGSNVPFDESIQICIFDNFGTKALRASPTFDLISRERVQPFGRTDCPETKNVCLEKGVYRRFVDLPRSNFGYILFYERCCRNDINNLINGAGGEPSQGQSYQAIIPPTNVANSSPYFAGVPVPFICINDTAEMSNLAIDPDGDILEYRMVDPWTGGELDPVPGCNGVHNPAKAVVYSAGHSTASPFSANGVAKINSVNGLTTFYATRTGIYAVAVEVIERRNGIILSTVRLELQILVINCPGNKKPNIGVANSYNVKAGKRLCFNVQGTDEDNNDLINLTGQAPILDGSAGFIGTRATFTPRQGRAPQTSEFCWTPDCNHARDQPYLVSFTVVDNGCPSKFKIVNVSIKVDAFASNIVVTGPTRVCNNQQNVVYTATNRAPNSVIKWSTSPNGSINGADNGISLSVNWDGGLEGYIYIQESTQEGCVGSLDSIRVELVPSPPAPIITGPMNVCDNDIDNYSITNLEPGNFRSWGAVRGTLLSLIDAAQGRINWGTKGDARVFARQTNILGCVSDTGFLEVTIHKPDPPQILGVQSICPFIQNVPYVIENSNPLYTYNWAVNPNGNIDEGQGTNAISVDWGAFSNNFVRAIAFDQFGCPSNPDSIPVEVAYALRGEIPQTRISVCEFSEFEYFVRFTPKSIYRWTISGGAIIQGDTGNRITIRWGVNGPGQVAVIEESRDTVNDLPCISLPNILNVTIHPNPIADEINGIFEICQELGASTPLTLAGFVNSSFEWTINGNAFGIVGQGTRTIQFPLGAEGSFNISVVETTEFGCVGNTIDSVLIVYPKPRTTPINGNAIVCYPNYDNNSYSVVGFSSSSFQWFLEGGLQTPAASITNATIINWSGQQNNTIKVLETSDFGCLGDTQTLSVFADKPSVQMRFVTVNEPPGSDDGMKIYWRLINAPRYNSKFVIQKKPRGANVPFANVVEVQFPILDYFEGPINTDITAFEYRILGYDLCNQELVSDSHINVLLSGVKNGPYEVELGFSDYSGWDEGISSYELHRYLPGKTGWVFQDRFSGPQARIDLKNGLDNYTQCYRIKALRANGSGADSVSWSNELCFNFDPVVWIPNAFTINGDRLNNDFRLVTGSIKTIEISVFNRWGELLFRTNDVNEGWDGKYKGNDCPLDVYMYMVKFTGFDDDQKIQSGTLHLIR